MTKQYAIDKAKIFFRETNESYFVIELDHHQYDVMNAAALERAIADGKASRTSIIFSIEADRTGETLF
ncbi:hypothetical protein [Paenibacillus humicola]|uniref:hypothetical protein n=1 Tax=Paenibacillus humicola TaxID=3110540 RepID=UPI00237B4206|nr:hypothetical protein [Paenibacillus humicola]